MKRYFELVFDITMVLAMIVSTIMSIVGLCYLTSGKEYSISLEVVTVVIAILTIAYCIKLLEDNI